MTKLDLMSAEQRMEQRRVEEQAKLDHYRREHPTEHPHTLTLRLWQGVMPRVTCPGQGMCPLWYGAEGEPGRCGLEIEFEELGSELLEYQIGPEFTPPTNPFPIGFTWSGGGEDEPPEIEWWPL
jgi:hypothetical protein